MLGNVRQCQPDPMDQSQGIRSAPCESELEEPRWDSEEFEPQDSLLRECKDNTSMECSTQVGTTPVIAFNLEEEDQVETAQRYVSYFDDGIDAPENAALPPNRPMHDQSSRRIQQFLQGVTRSPIQFRLSVERSRWGMPKVAKQSSVPRGIGCPWRL